MVERRPAGRAPSPWLEGVTWLALGAAVTAALVAARQRVGSAHVALLYLLVVLGASARGGRRVGLVLAAACFVAFNVFFVRPYGTLAVRDPLDWVVLLAFLATSTVAAQLLHRARAEASAARARSLELQRLATLGAEALQAPRAEEAAAAVARVIREELAVRECELFLRGSVPDELQLVARATPGGAESPAGEAPRRSSDVLLAADARTLLLPLEVHARPVGLLLLRADTSISADVARHPLAEVLAYYAALGLERIRLSRAAEHADALREADRLKDALLSAVSHDLRTPLTTIKAVAHEIAERGDDRAAEIETEADRLNRYVTNLLDLSRLDAGALRVTRELVPVDDLLGAVLQQVAAVTGGRDVRVEMTSDWPSLVGHCDFVLSMRVVANLVENAVRHSPGGPVEIRASRDGEWIRVAVADHGPGVPPQERERIFQPFERGQSISRAEGTGLGLAIARRLAEAQGGTLEYAERTGGGSVFTVALPAAEVADVARRSL